MKRQSRETRRYEKKRENDNIKIISNIQLPFQEPIHNSTHIGQPTPPQQNNKKKMEKIEEGEYEDPESQTSYNTNPGTQKKNT